MLFNVVHIASTAKIVLWKHKPGFITLLTFLLHGQHSFHISLVDPEKTFKTLSYLLQSISSHPYKFRNLPACLNQEHKSSIFPTSPLPLKAFQPVPVNVLLARRLTLEWEKRSRTLTVFFSTSRLHVKYVEIHVDTCNYALARFSLLMFTSFIHFIHAHVIPAIHLHFAIPHLRHASMGILDRPKGKSVNQSISLVLTSDWMAKNKDNKKNAIRDFLILWDVISWYIFCRPKQNTSKGNKTLGIKRHFHSVLCCF